MALSIMNTWLNFRRNTTQETKDISQLTVAQMSQQLTLAYTSVINSNLPLSNIPSVMIWGPPGVGKSQGIRQIASDVSALTGKRVVVTDVRLLLFNVY